MHKNRDKTNERLHSLVRKFTGRVRSVSPEIGCIVALAQAEREDIDDQMHIRFSPIAESVGGTQWSMTAALMDEICTVAQALSHPTLNGAAPYVTDSKGSVMQFTQLVEGCIRGYLQGNADQRTTLALVALAYGIIKGAEDADDMDDSDDMDDTDKEEQ